MGFSQGVPGKIKGTVGVRVEESTDLLEIMAVFVTGLVGTLPTNRKGKGVPITTVVCPEGT